MKHILLYVFFFNSLFAFADYESKLSKEIGYFLHHKDYEEAIRILNEPSNKNLNNAEWNYLMGKCHYLSESPDSAFTYLRIADSLGSDHSEIQFILGEMHHLNNEFDIAKNHYLIYQQSEESQGKEALVDPATLSKRIEECENGIYYLAQAKQVPIENLGSTINSEYPDYAPVISADEQTLFFTSRRPNSTGGYKDASDGWHMEDIYICIKDNNNEWTEPQQLPSYINSIGHDANIGLSPDGQRLFIYKDDELEEGLAGDIYESNWKFDRWSTPLLMHDPINTRHWETGVSITPDEKTLYFSSNRPGGYGGLDIYSVQQLPNGEWALPQNLGPNINTEHDEESPFIHPDGRTLYFSSEGHSSMGGFDIFFSELDDTLWSEPENLGYPLNTAQNELYFVLSADARRGYFSGVRDQTFGDKDIYVANLPERPVQIILLKGKVVDKQTDKPLATLIKVFDNKSKDLIYVLNSNGVNGRFSSILPPHKNYNVQIEVEQAGYAHYSINIHIPEQEEFVEVDTVIRLQREDSVHVVSLLPNIFFKLNLAEIDSSSILELDALAARMFKNPKMNLEVAVHSYSQNSSKANKSLSQQRADVIKKELVDRGVSDKRIFPVGYGEFFPTEMEKRKWESEGVRPRDRVEAIIIPAYEASLNPDFDGYYYKQGYDEFDYEPDEEGLMQGDSVLANNDSGEQNPTTDIDGDDDTETLEPGQLPKMDDLTIHFRFNKIYFREKPDSVFAEVIAIMEANPEIHIEIQSFTDTVGHPDYNLFLSQIRADHAMKTMIEQGADPNRLSAKGYGPIKPKYSNKTDEGRKNNRRAEFMPFFKED